MAPGSPSPRGRPCVPLPGQEGRGWRRRCQCFIRLTLKRALATEEHLFITAFDRVAEKTRTGEPDGLHRPAPKATACVGSRSTRRVCNTRAFPMHFWGKFTLLVLCGLGLLCCLNFCELFPC